MQPLGGKDIRLDPTQQWRQHGAARAHLVSQGRQAERHALSGIALRLAVQRLMLPVLLEQDHRQQARAGPAARDDMKRRRRLADPLAVTASTHGDAEEAADHDDEECDVDGSEEDTGVVELILPSASSIP